MDNIVQINDRAQELMSLATIEEIVADIRCGKPVIIVDDEDRENEGDFIVAAQMATPENINFMARYGRGLICLPMEGGHIDRLGLEPMGRGDNAHHRTAFTVSIEAKEGVTTGISAADRAHTIQTAIRADSCPEDIATPGHVFPLRARDGGVLVRAGHTEAAVDLAKMAGFSGAGVICEIMNDDGTMARLPDLMGIAKQHGVRVGTIADLIAYRRRTEKLIEKVLVSEITSAYGGKFKSFIYATKVHYAEHIALVKGDISGKEPVLVRMHALNLLDDVLGAGDAVLARAMRQIEEAGRGVVVLLRPPNAKSLSQALSAVDENKPNKSGDISPETPPVLRNYGVGAQILLDLGVENMTLLTNSPKAVIGLEGYGLNISGHKPIQG